MSNERTITDTDLVEFCKWYADFHGDTDIETSVIVTCLCGYFHTFPKAADKLLMRCKKSGLVVANGDTWNIQIGGHDLLERANVGKPHSATLNNIF